MSKGSTLLPAADYDSKLELEHHRTLLYLASQGSVSHVSAHPPAELRVNGQYMGRYTIDFTYRQNGYLIGDECKGYFHEKDRFRFKLFLALYSHEFEMIRLQDQFDEQFYPVKLDSKGRLVSYRQGKWVLWKFTRKSKSTSKRGTRNAWETALKKKYKQNQRKR